MLYIFGEVQACILSMIFFRGLPARSRFGEGRLRLRLLRRLISHLSLVVGR